MSTPQADFGLIDNAQMFKLILDNDPAGENLLYKRYARGLLFLATRYSPEDAEACIQKAVHAVIGQIKAGQLTASAALPGSLATSLRRAAWNANLEAKRQEGDQQDSPSRLLEVKEQARLIKDGLQRLEPVEREILTRFYLQGQTPEQICTGLHLTQIEFRFLKCRSKQLLARGIAQAKVRPVGEEHSTSSKFVH